MQKVTEEPDHPVQQESGAVIMELGEQSWSVPTVSSIATDQIEINMRGQPENYRKGLLKTHK